MYIKIRLLITRERSRELRTDFIRGKTKYKYVKIYLRFFLQIVPIKKIRLNNESSIRVIISTV